MKATRMAGHLIRRLHQKSTQVFASKLQQEGLDLTPVQFSAMDAIRSVPGLDQAQIATLIAYDRATIGGVIDRLEKKGLVVRTVSTKDRRAREVRLTEAGNELFQKALPVVFNLQNDILDGLDDVSRDVFLKLIETALREDKA
ncbi:MarR family transcriptional regulator [Ruegeria sp. HKCCD4884]|uniref:MarR family winged helix-turn-helix transcriptional regulator n=1 Tax=Ruegeria sp. HKCCD4884 TaxID=2683022 RepID=UPI00149278F8|nr:MarR family transcriptional regulator [Ruegeria sp. HKCCD4884]NOD93632.1 MarR family transcriptional regulator [Ruegeria sp. HKCCD4884]